MGKISWTDCLKNEDALHKVKKKENILYTIKRRKAKWIGHILRINCLLEHVIVGRTEVKIDVTGRRGKRCKQILDDLKKTRRYWKLKEKH